MPLFDFACRQCGHRFEALVRPGHEPVCPSCQSADLEKLLSLFAVSTAERRQASAAASRRKQREVAGRDATALNAESEKHRLEDH
jgi:putative FmdB family regulatory protein